MPFTQQGRQSYIQTSTSSTKSLYSCPAVRVKQLYPQAPGSRFIFFYVSQGYGGGILIRLRMQQNSVSLPLIKYLVIIPWLYLSSIILLFFMA
jgi:hypothetical protein